MSQTFYLLAMENEPTRLASETWERDMYVAVEWRKQR
jgi:hypothetical protein